MNKKYLALFSFVLSVISPLVCFASSDGGSGASGIFKIVFLRAQKKKGSILYRRNREKTFFRLFLKACCFPAAPGAKTRPCAAGGTWRKFFVSASVF